MFGQPQPQYGYPQQGYGYQPQQRQPAQLSSLGDLLAGNSAKAYFGANSQPGDSVTGVIEKIETTQVNDFQTKQPAFWNDGRPKEQIHVIIQTQLRDPSVDDDDGRRSLWIKGSASGATRPNRRRCSNSTSNPRPASTVSSTEANPSSLSSRAPSSLPCSSPSKVTRSGSTRHSSLSRPRIRDIRQLRWTRGTLPRNSSRSNPLSRCSSASRSSRRLIR